MSVYRLVQFTLLIRINHRLHEFNFLYRKNGFYETDTVDSNGTRVYFKLVNEKDAWKIEGVNIPGWILQNEQLISEALSAKDPLNSVNPARLQ